MHTHMQTVMQLCAELVLRLLVEEEEGLTRTKAAQQEEETVEGGYQTKVCVFASVCAWTELVATQKHCQANVCSSFCCHLCSELS